MLSQITTKDYLKQIPILLEEEFRERNQKLTGSPSLVISRHKVFLDIFVALAGSNNDGIREERLVSELVMTGRFSESEARSEIGRFAREGRIYESRPGIWTK